ncbi:MAG: hypothetical protein HY925_05980 [Elusimicrobia bacterium]|nr:hypothetical protein [Elusimicrobiota bacterium]
MAAVRFFLAFLACLAAAGCAHHGYFLDEQTKRIYTKDSWGRVTKWYEPDTQEYNAVALRFYPGLLDKPMLKPSDDEPSRRGRLKRFMQALDRDQWHILLDLELWTGDDKIDLAHLEDLERVAKAVDGMPFDDFMRLKEQYPIRPELMARLLKGDKK